jgi:hypothetical protein
MCISSILSKRQALYCTNSTEFLQSLFGFVYDAHPLLDLAISFFERVLEWLEPGIELDDTCEQLQISIWHLLNIDSGALKLHLPVPSFGRPSAAPPFAMELLEFSLVLSILVF